MPSCTMHFSVECFTARELIVTEPHTSTWFCGCLFVVRVVCGLEHAGGRPKMDLSVITDVVFLVVRWIARSVGRGVTTSSLSCSSSWTTTRSWRAVLHGLALRAALVHRRPDTAMRVTLWALMGAGGKCNKHTQDTSLHFLLFSDFAVIGKCDCTGRNPLHPLQCGFHLVLLLPMLSNRTCLFCSHRHQISSDCRHGLGIFCRASSVISGRVSFHIRCGVYRMMNMCLDVSFVALLLDFFVTVFFSPFWRFSFGPMSVTGPS